MFQTTMMRRLILLLLSFISLTNGFDRSDESSNFGLAIPQDAVGRPQTPLRNIELLEKQTVVGVRDIPENYCYCSYGHEEGVCDRNFTCIKHDLAACFHAIEEVYNNEERRMETWHKYGCAPLEKGSDASHLTCNGWRSAHFHPKSIACCYEGNYCNRDIEPPPYANLEEHDWDDLHSVSIRQSNVLKVAGAVMGIVVLIIFGIIAAYRYTKLMKEKNKVRCPTVDDDKDPMLYEDSGSGSGKGLTTLNQRTVAQDLTIIKVIGRGRYGEVRKALYRGSYVAVKTFYTTDEDSWKNERDVYQTQMLNHENILQFVAADICSEDSITQMLLITDYHELGSLCDYLRKDRILNIHEAVKLAHSTICGMEHLHTAVHGTGSRRKPEIAHRDIKSKNIIVKREGVCCVADFGLAVRFENKMIPEKVNIQVGTKRYMAPEVLSKTLNPKNFQQFKMADMYSFALVLWEICRRVECQLPANTSDPSGEASDSSGIGESLSSSQSNEKQYEPKVHMQKTSVDMSTRSRPYVPPFEGMVENDPSFDEMARIVCEEGMRPPIEQEWRDGSNKTLYRMTSLMIDCWHTRPDCRHTALKVKKELLKILDSLSNRESLDTVLSSPSFKKETDSGICNKEIQNVSPDLSLPPYTFLKATDSGISNKDIVQIV